MLPPLFIDAQSDRYKNYPVLLALLPAAFGPFNAYDKRPVAWDALLHLIDGAAALTGYSAAPQRAGTGISKRSCGVREC